MVSSHNETVPEAVPSEALPEPAPSSGTFPNQAASTDFTPIKEEEDNEDNPGSPPSIDTHIKQEEDNVEMPPSPSPPPSPRALLHDYPPPIDARIQQEEDDVEMPPSPPPSPPPPSPPPSPPLPSPPPSPPPSPTHRPPEQPPNLEQVNEAQGIVVAAPSRGEVINDVLMNNNDGDEDAIMMGVTGTGNGNNVSKKIFL